MVTECASLSIRGPAAWTVVTRLTSTSVAIPIALISGFCFVELSPIALAHSFLSHILLQLSRDCLEERQPRCVKKKMIAGQHSQYERSVRVLAPALDLTAR